LLCLSFTIRGALYALPARHILEVLPCLELRVVPRAPAYVRGLLDLYGRATPVLDLSLLAGGAECAPLLSTRIVLVDAGLARGESSARVGMMVEGATDTLELPERSLADPPLRLPDAPFLGRVAEHDEGMVQLVEPAGLLLDEVRRLIETDDAGPAVDTAAGAQTRPTESAVQEEP
jgi:chemotaxis-related protein WspB